MPASRLAATSTAATAIPRPPRFVRIQPLARAAEGAALLGARNGAEYRELPCRTILNRCVNENMPFAWTINPYRGCEFGCRYCYARYTHEFMGLDESSLFETEIFAKRGAAAALERELPPGREVQGGIAIGTATEPYQPAERKHLITRSLLEVFARREGLRLSITTKSDLVTRDLDLLMTIARSNDLTVNFSITTLHRRLARLLEPRAPRPLLRFRAMEALANAGIATGLFIMPIIPGLTDSPIALETLVAHAAAAGARRVGHQVLFLRLSAKKVFLPFLRETFPKLAPHYRRVYSASPTHTPEYRRRIDEAMKALKERHGFEQKRSQEREGRPRPQPRGQLALAF